jgi:osmotically-inducible protein OsmY
MGIKVRTNDVRQAGERARARISGEPQGPGWLGALGIGIVAGATGAVVAFLADPQRGKARRTQLADQGAATVRHAAREAERVVRAVTSTAEGKLEALAMGGSRVAPNDDVTLRDRAESILFRDPKVPKGSINISAERGTLVLRGEVPNARMRNKLAREAEKIEGVWGVENLLHLPGESAGEGLAPTLTGAATN